MKENLCNEQLVGLNDRYIILVHRDNFTKLFLSPSFSFALFDHNTVLTPSR